MADFFSFNEFMDNLQTARLGHQIDKLRAARRGAGTGKKNRLTFAGGDSLEEEFAKMRNYLQEHYKDVRSEHTFLDAEGNHIDCIPFEQQATVRAAKKAGHPAPKAAPQPAKREPAHRDASAFGPESFRMPPPLRRGLVDVLGNPMSCPEDCVPIRRVTLSQLAQLGKLGHFFRKAGRASQAPPLAGPEQQAAPPGAGTGHRWAICQTGAGPFFGSSTTLNSWDEDPSPGVFNLSQLWITGNVGARSPQTIESGWQIFPTGPFATTAPGIFVYYNPDGSYNINPDGSPKQPATCGYFQNELGQGFSRWHDGNGWPLGTSLPGPFSKNGGPQYEFVMEWQIDATGRWWLFLGNDVAGLVPVGYFEAGTYEGPLAQAGQSIQFGGEVAAVEGSTATGKMGSGIPPYPDPTDGYGEVAYQREIQVGTSLGGDYAAADLTIVTPAGDSSQYYKAALGGNDNWGSFLFFGGAGGP